MFDKIKEKAQSAASAASGIASSITEKGAVMVKESLEQVNSLRPILAKAGFIVGDLSVGMSLTPTVKIILEQTETSEMSLSEVLAQLETPNAMQKAVLNSLISIYKMEEQIKAKGHTIGQVEVELGLPPGVTVHLNSLDSRAFSTAQRRIESS